MRKLWASAITVSLVLTATTAWAWTDEQIAQAIFKAENSHKHPYGILKAYCKPGDPDGKFRLGCIQTIQHARNDWDGKGDFITALQKRYCPIGSNTDNGTCRYWVKNVKGFLHE